MTIFAAAMSNDNKKFLSLAVPLIISSISTPLLGVVDTAVMGRFPQAAYIGGVAIATLIFNTMYWLLGFLRISTSGFSAQASGTGDKKTITSALLRPMAIAFILGVLLVVLQYPIKIAAFMLVTPSNAVRTLAETYYDIRIWGAPFVLIGYVMNGWLAGMSKVKLSLCLQIFMNILNILLVLLFVRIGGMAADGVATATLISEIAATVLGFVLIYHIKEVSITGISLAIFCNIAAFTAMMKVNRDLFIRTVCLLSVYNLMAIYGMRYGEVVLAANAVLMQIHFVMANLLGGIGNTATILVGKAIGGKDGKLYKSTVQLTAFWGWVTAFLLFGGVCFFKNAVIGLFTNLSEVKQLADMYIYWVGLFPLSAVWGLQLYGIFAGATLATPIRNSMLYSLLACLIVFLLGEPFLGNHGIWLAFTVFSLGRSIFLWIYLPGLNKKVAVIAEK